MADSIVLPDHYSRFPLEPIRFIVENKLNWFQGNIIKYTCRYDAKNGMEDLMKAARYNEMQRKFIAGDPEWWRKPEPVQITSSDFHAAIDAMRNTNPFSWSR